MPAKIATTTAPGCAARSSPQPRTASPRCGVTTRSLELSLVDGAATADVRRVLGVQTRAKFMIRRAVPDGHHAGLRHGAEIDAIGRGDHAAGHRLARVGDV